MYKSIKEFDNKISGIKRLSDNAYIPFDIQNSDYVAYLKWVEAGNTPLPVDSEETV